MKIIKVKNVSAWYGDFCALENVNFEIEEKDFTGIIGPNGGGKSTLIKILLGLKKPETGTVDIRTDHKNPFGYVPQFTTFGKDFPVSVEETVLMGLLTKKAFPYVRFNRQDQKLACEAMAKLGIEHLKVRRINSLSGGQLQKVMIARAVVADPPILILDEPVSNIDAKSEIEIYDLLKELNKEKTVIMVSHNTSIISSYFKTLLCVNKHVYHHDKSEMNGEELEKVYGSPIELISHGNIPRLILPKHEEHNHA